MSRQVATPVFSEDANSDAVVVVPAYNEERCIGEVLAELVQRRMNVIVVDDGSSDRTAAVALDYPVLFLRHVCNLGQGAALQTGITCALRLPWVRYLVTFDSDGQHSVDDIPAILAPLRGGDCDVTLGSRFLEGSQAIGMSPLKHFTLLMATVFTRTVTGLSLTDTHNGLRGMTAEAAATINISQNGMAHASELLSQISFHRLGYREIPVTIRYTTYSRMKGQSLFNSVNIIWEMLMGGER